MAKCNRLTALSFKGLILLLFYLQFDLIYCYKILFGLVHLQVSDFFEMAPLLTTRGHAYKLYKKRSSATVRCEFFSVDFTNLTRFVRTVKRVDLSGYLRCFSYSVLLCI